MTQTIELGLLFSRSGTYSLISESCRQGALAAIDAVNREGKIFLVPVERDPEGNIDRYAPLAADILNGSSARNIVGCITSWSRKEVIPVLEKHGGMLWYPAPYEGFEASENVVYMHACPNQHLLPLVAHVVPRFGGRGFLVGSNYIWGWETNRIARDLIRDAGGEVLSERYLGLGDEDVGRIIEEIRAQRPNFILNNFVGATSYAFFRAYAALGAEDAWFLPDRCPLISCNLSEAELSALGTTGEGTLSVGPYFASARDPVPLAGSFTASAYSAVRILAKMLAENPDGTLDFAGREFETPLGQVAIDPATRHTRLPVKIARIEGGVFKVIDESPQSVAPDPYLSRYDPLTSFGRAALRVVS